MVSNGTKSVLWKKLWKLISVVEKTMEINQCWAMVLNQCCGKNYKKLWKLIRVKTKTIVLNQCQQKIIAINQG